MKAAALGVGVSAVILLIKKSNPEMALVLGLATGILVLRLAFELISGVGEVIDVAVRLSALEEELVTPVLKCIGIGVVTKLASDTCKDAGSSTIGSAVELVGAASALYVTLPLLKTLVQMIGGLI